MSSSQTEQAVQVCESLLTEHRAMETLLLSWENQLNSLPEDAATSSPALGALETLLHTTCRDMNVHFACEERALFPAVSPYHPMVLMEVEHEELVALRDELMAQFAEKQFAGFRETSQRFIEYMRDHIAREDGGIFPTCERALSVDEKHQVIEEMDRIRAQAKTEDVPAIVRPEKSCQPIGMDLNATPDRPLTIALLAEKPGFQIKQLTIRAGESLASHWSPKRLLVWCVAGEACFNTEPDTTLTLRPGAGVLLDPQLNHAIHAQTDCHLLLVLQDVAP